MVIKAAHHSRWHHLSLLIARDCVVWWSTNSWAHGRRCLCRRHGAGDEAHQCHCRHRQQGRVRHSEQNVHSRSCRQTTTTASFGRWFEHVCTDACGTPHRPSWWWWWVVVVAVVLVVAAVSLPPLQHEKQTIIEKRKIDEDSSQREGVE